MSESMMLHISTKKFLLCYEQFLFSVVFEAPCIMNACYFYRLNSIAQDYYDEDDNNKNDFQEKTEIQTTTAEPEPQFMQKENDAQKILSIIMNRIKEISNDKEEK